MAVSRHKSRRRCAGHLKAPSLGWVAYYIFPGRHRRQCWRRHGAGCGSDVFESFRQLLRPNRRSPRKSHGCSPASIYVHHKRQRFGCGAAPRSRGRISPGIAPENMGYASPFGLLLSKSPGGVGDEDPTLALGWVLSPRSSSISSMPDCTEACH